MKKINIKLYMSASFQQNAAFTLAEVLITLGIIGIVAAMSIVTLYNNTQDAQHKNSLKVAYSLLSQVYTKAKDDNGGSISGLCVNNDSICFANLFKPYMEYSGEVSGVPDSNNLQNCWNSKDLFYSNEYKVCLILDNAMVFVFDKEYYDCTTMMCGVADIDVNGFKAPNKWGKDRYELYLYNDKLVFPIGSCQNGSDAGLMVDNVGCAKQYFYEGN